MIKLCPFLPFAGIQCETGCVTGTSKARLKYNMPPEDLKMS